MKHLLGFAGRFFTLLSAYALWRLTWKSKEKSFW